jgi:hypothetical protein
MKQSTEDKATGKVHELKFLFHSESGLPLTQRNVLRDGLGKIRKDMKLEDGKAFHSFRRFRTSHLRKNRVPASIEPQQTCKERRPGCSESNCLVPDATW